jgi:hypothetical protein
MKTRLSQDRISWETIALWLAVAAVAAWGVGFAVGVIVRFLFGS